MIPILLLTLSSIGAQPQTVGRSLLAEAEGILAGVRPTQENADAWMKIAELRTRLCDKQEARHAFAHAWNCAIKCDLPDERLAGLRILVSTQVKSGEIEQAIRDVERFVAIDERAILLAEIADSQASAEDLASVRAHHRPHSRS